MSETIRARFTLDRETKNTVRYQEVTETGKEAVVGTLYVRKDAAAALGGPDELEVTIGALR